VLGFNPGLLLLGGNSSDQPEHSQAGRSKVQDIADDDSDRSQQGLPRSIYLIDKDKAHDNSPEKEKQHDQGQLPPDFIGPDQGRNHEIRPE